MVARSWRALALAMSVLGAHGCVDDGVSLHVICPIQPTLDDDSCLFEADGETCVGEGVMNLYATRNYTLVLRVESGLKPRERDVPPMGEPNGVQLRSATIEIRRPDGARWLFNPSERAPAPPNPFTVTAAGYVAPGGFDAVAITVIDEQRGEQLRGAGSQIVAAIKLKGVTNGSTDVEGGEYVWPIRLIDDDTCLDLSYCLNMRGQGNFAQACE